MRAGDWPIRIRAGLLYGLERLGGAEKSGGMNAGHFAASGKTNGNIGRGNIVGKFRDDQDIVRIHGEKSGVDGTAQSFDGRTYGFKAVFGVFQDAGPGGGSEANLVTEVGHKDLFLGEGISRKD